MSNDIQLRIKAREAIQAGHLPKRSPDKMWGGPASGAPCAICGVETTLGVVELELEFFGDSDKARTTNYSVHPHCFAIFNLELQRLLTPPDPEKALDLMEGKVPRNDCES